MNRRLTLANALIAYLVAVLVLGGASAAGVAANALLQLGAVALIGYCLWRPDPDPAPRAGLKPLLVAFAILVAVQFVPLPWAAWRQLPGREVAAAGAALIGADHGWATLSFSPWASLASLAWWLPAAALTIGMARSDGPAPATISRAVMAVALAAVALALFQRGAGLLYLYEITNVGAGVGFFANANHQGSFLLAAMALWAALYADVAAAREMKRADPARVFAFYATGLILVVGILFTSSLATLSLMVPVVLAGIAISRPDLHLSPRIVIPAVVVLSIGALALVLSGVLEENFVGQAGNPDHNRMEFLRVGLGLAKAVAPIGSGLGTFVNIYPWFEPAATIEAVYVNHAHNDLLELLIETGIFGLATLVLFLTWFARAGIAAWRARERNPYAQAATILCATLLLHSLVDYPLRTAAVSSLFGIGCALLVRPHRKSRAQSRKSQPAPRQASVVI